MIPSGSASSIGGAPAVVPSLLRSNSGLLGGAHSNSFPSHSPFPSLPSPRDQFNTNELLSDISNVSSLLNHSFVNGLAASGAPPVNIQNQGSIRGGVAEITGHIETNTMPFGQQFQKTSRNHHGLDHPHSQPHDGTPKFQQQFSVSQGQQQIMGGLNRTNNMPPVKLEPQMVAGDQNASSQQLQAIRNMGTVMKEHHYSDPSIIFQQQQPFLHISNQSSQAASQMNLLQKQQRIQQQIVNTFADQYPQQQGQQQVHQQSLSLRSQVKSGGYEPGACAQRLTSYMYHQQNRPEDNNIEFWRKFVLDYFAPNAKKRWCVSLYGSGRQTTGIFPQDLWHCEICSRMPGRGFETTVEVLPRLCQIKYASGTLEELLYVDMPHEYLNASGQVVLEYAKAIQETVFDQLRVVRDGQLRIVFNQDLKIASWEFCARRHEELIPRRLLIPQVSQLRAVLHKYQATTQNSSSLPAQDFQNICNSFVSSARQLAKALEVPLVNDLGYTKRYVRCLQISEVVNSMKDLIDYSKETGTGPMDSLINFPRAMNASPGFTSQQTQQLQEQQYLSQNLNQSNQNSSHPTSMQIASPAAPIATSTANIDSILQNSMMSSRPENQMSTACSPYGGMNTVQMPPASASISVSQSQHKLSSNNNPSPTSQFSLKNSNTTSLSSYIKQPAVETRSATNPNDFQSSVQQILHERLMPLHPNSVSTTAHELKGISGISRAAIRGGNCLVGNGTGGIEFGEMGRGITPTASSTGIRAAINSNALSMAGRVAAGHISENFVGMNHQLDVGSRLLGGLGAVNGFSGLQFD